MNFLSHLPDEIIIVITLIAVGIGIYGLLILFNLKSRLMYNSLEKKDKMLIGSFNVAISMVSICIIMLSIIQIDTYSLFKELSQLLKQFK